MNRDLIYEYLKKRETALLFSIFLLSGIISLNAPEFLRPENILNIVVNNAMYGIMATGMTLVLVTGNIDISVGAQFAVISMITSAFANWANEIGIVSPVFAFGLSILLGITLGFINGYLTTKIRLPAVILTLGTMSIMRGTLLIITKGSWIVSLPSWVTMIAGHRFFGVHIPVYIWLATAAGIILLLKYTMLGRNILALGGNADGAVRIGISRENIYRFVFAVFGATVGIGSTIYIAQLGSAQPTAGSGYEFTVVGATIIGGNSLSGGNASVIGTCLGVLLLGVVRNALVLMRIPVYWQSLVTGLIIIVAIVFSYRSQSGRS